MESVIDQGLFQGSLINSTDISKGKIGTTMQQDDVDKWGLSKTSYFASCLSLVRAKNLKVVQVVILLKL